MLTLPVLVRRASVAGALVAVAAAAAPAGAQTDPAPAASTPITGGTGPASARAGWVAYSTKPDAQGWQLVLRDPKGTVTTPNVPRRGSAFDVRLGQASGGEVVATYSRCASSRCRLYRLDTAAGTETRLALSAGDVSETRPALAGSRLAFVATRSGRPDAIRVRDLKSGKTRTQPRGTLDGGQPTKVKAIDFDGSDVASIWTGRTRDFFEYALFTQKRDHAAKLRDETQITGDGCGNTQFTEVALGGSAVYTLLSGGAGWQVERAGLTSGKPRFGAKHLYPTPDGGPQPDARETGIAADGATVTVAATTSLQQLPAAAPDAKAAAVYDDSGCA